MPLGIIAECNRLMRKFLWGGVDGGSKIAWVEWAKVCSSKEVGGLGVKDLRLFNRALLGKWRWRLLREKSSLWYRILSAKYNGSVHANDSLWWRDLCSMCYGEVHGKWFNESICRRIGNGKEVAFWNENWVDRGELSSLFPRLFTLSNQKDATISEMRIWEDGRWRWKFEWQRNLLERELPRVVDMVKQIGSFSPKLGVCDSWCWVKDGSGVYSVKSAYVELQGNLGVVERTVFSRIWRAKAPSGQKALAWRIIINRVQTRVDLLKRNALPVNASVLCGLCASDEENCGHLFFK